MSKTEELSPRLMTVVSLIPSCKSVVDVGSDHGKLGVWCLQNNRCEQVVATDIHTLPAERTKEKLREAGLEERSEVHVADGLCGVALQSDMTVVIAGMGGLEIIKILKAAHESSGIPAGLSFVLQPQRSHYELRSYLSGHGWEIRDEKIALERGHFYTVMYVCYTGRAYSMTDKELFLGPVILKKKPEHYDAFMAHEKNVMAKRAIGDPRCAEILKNWKV